MGNPHPTPPPPCSWGPLTLRPHPCPPPHLPTVTLALGDGGAGRGGPFPVALEGGGTAGGPSPPPLTCPRISVGASSSPRWILSHDFGNFGNKGQFSQVWLPQAPLHGSRAPKPHRGPPRLCSLGLLGAAGDQPLREAVASLALRVCEVQTLTPDGVSGGRPVGVGASAQAPVGSDGRGVTWDVDTGEHFWGRQLGDASAGLAWPWAGTADHPVLHGAKPGIPEKAFLGRANGRPKVPVCICVLALGRAPLASTRPGPPALPEVCALPAPLKLDMGLVLGPQPRGLSGGSAQVHGPPNACPPCRGGCFCRS
ncbi:uncharacterized protein LOC119520922 isoform X1 [Choloepus didactylus]|uniref:uncharacterized protein LOC119520922 isoform X1 n=1 Tax=Choloepus didactylus TaxID=27675 RepID=UPI00189E1345|nr:uncharacterized protein LOC119520922 isoform X1 [Choloepus didactylus]